MSDPIISVILRKTTAGLMATQQHAVRHRITCRVETNSTLH